MSKPRLVCSGTVGGLLTAPHPTDPAPSWDGLPTTADHVGAAAAELATARYPGPAPLSDRTRLAFLVEVEEMLADLDGVPPLERSVSVRATVSGHLDEALLVVVPATLEAGTTVGVRLTDAARARLAAAGFERVTLARAAT